VHCRRPCLLHLVWGVLRWLKLRLNEGLKRPLGAQIVAVLKPILLLIDCKAAVKTSAVRLVF
jgi:hypothetical protein